LTENISADTPERATDPDFFRLLTCTFQHLIGKSLVDPTAGPKWLYAEAPFVVLAHNTDTDPCFIYANRTAQSVFGYSWDEFIGLPSRFSAEAPERGERERLLENVTRNGFITDYRGVRVKKDGHRFRIEDGIVWQLRDENGRHQGQAATFSSWTDL